MFIVVLAFNCRQPLLRCLRSLSMLTYSDLHVVVVDNGSGDGTEGAVRCEFPHFDFLQTGANLGYTGGNNRGIEWALDHEAGYVLILNPDTVVANASFIETLLDLMNGGRDVGIAGPRVFLGSPGTVQNTVLFPPGLWRNIIHWFRFRVEPGFGHLSGDELVEAEVLNGVCILIRTRALRATGLFDEKIFMYIEDADLDYRMRAAGWKVMYCPVDGVIHEQKQDGYSMTSFVSFLLRRNSVYYLAKIGKRFDAWAYAALSLLLMWTRALCSALTGRFVEHAFFCLGLFREYKRILVHGDVASPDRLVSTWVKGRRTR